jgi:hypothetical protein
MKGYWNKKSSDWTLEDLSQYRWDHRFDGLMNFVITVAVLYSAFKTITDMRFWFHEQTAKK